MVYSNNGLSKRIFLGKFYFMDTCSDFKCPQLHKKTVGQRKGIFKNIFIGVYRWPSSD